VQPRREGADEPQGRGGSSARHKGAVLRQAASAQRRWRGVNDSAGPVAVIVTKITTAAEFVALRDPWRLLSEGREEISVFLSWEWQYYWWKHYGAGRELYLLAASEQGQLIGFLPLYKQQVSFGFGFRATLLRMIGTGSDTTPDYLGCVAVAAREAQVISGCLGYLAQHLNDWDAALFSDYLASSALAEHVPEWAYSLNLRSEEVDAQRIAYSELPATWDAYLSSLTRGRRHKLRGIRRRFLALPQARLFVWEDLRDFDNAFDRLVALHRLRWEARRRRHAFSSPQYIAFHRELARACMVNGWLRLYCMAVGDEIVAMLYCYLQNGTLYFFQSGFDPKYEEHSPGQCLMAFAIESAIREKSQRIDMLRGDYQYKSAWAKEVRTTFRTIVYRNTPRARLHRFRHLVLPRFKRRVIAAFKR